MDLSFDESFDRVSALVASLILVLFRVQVGERKLLGGRFRIYQSCETYLSHPVFFRFFVEVVVFRSFINAVLFRSFVEVVLFDYFSNYPCLIRLVILAQNLGLRLFFETEVIIIRFHLFQKLSSSQLFSSHSFLHPLFLKILY